MTLGSDAHNQEYLCRHFNSTIEKIKLCGFDKITYYENRNPVQIIIDGYSIEQNNLFNVFKNQI